ncbi:MAG TPA: TonB-dependent receptor [Bryobacteraceae bacterium]|jgi:hypothetical protein|nr:TonB-dependent receptor [Bryobacteraceae bacterium]
MAQSRTVTGCVLALASFAIALLCVPQACAQVLYGSVAGTVTDQSGRAIAGAAVGVINTDTGLARNTTTGAAGEYSITDLPPGTYTLDVSASGFAAVKKTDIRISVGSVNQQDAQLSVGAVSQQITVSGATPALQTETTDVHTTISGYAVQNLPLNVYHNFQSLEVLAPGVFSSSGIANSYPNANDGFEKSFSINANGLPAHINTTRVDGATDIYLWLPDHILITPPADTVEEVNVQTATYNIQKGLTAGAATDVITKSGTNEFHGSIYAYNTNQAIDAQNALVTQAKPPKYILNNDGFTLGGPIKKNKLFFFGNWDGDFERQNVPSTFNIPTMDMRAGDFSAYLGDRLYNANGTPAMVCTTQGNTVQLRQGMIFDPATGNPSTGQGRCVFQDGGIVNKIPASRLYAGSLNYWKILAPYTPNDLTGPFTANTSIDDIRLRNRIWNRTIYTGKVDYNISDRQIVWAKYSIQQGSLDDASNYGLAGQGAGIGRLRQTSQMATAAHSWTATPHLVLSGHVGFLRMGMNEHTLDFGQNYGQSVLGLTNSNTPADDKRYSGMPGIVMQGFSSLGTYQSYEPEFRNDWTLTLDENATWMKGKHTVMFGFDAAHDHLNEWQPEIVCCPRGGINASQYNTFLNTAPAANPAGSQAQFYNSSGTKVGFSPAAWNSVAEFDLGLASASYNAQQFIKQTGKEWQNALYIGDTYRFTSKLTINAGLRWEYFPLITRDGMSKFDLYDPSTNRQLLGGIAGNPTHLGVTSSKLLFAPRFGFAYQPGAKTVIRSAFGIAYDTLPLERPLRGFYPYAIGQTGQLTGNSRITQFLPYASFNTGTNAANNIPGLADGVPLIAAPAGLDQGYVLPPAGVTVGTMAPGEFKRGYVESWNFSIEQKLPANILLGVAYVGNHFVHELNGAQLNAAPLGTGSAGQPLFARFGRFADTYQFQGYLDSHYNSLQVSLHRRVSGGLFLQGSYTYSKVIGYMNDEGWENGLSFNCPPSPLMPDGCLSLNRQTLSFDHTHVLKMSFVYDLPFGAGRKWANTNGAAKAILGGWEINGIFSAWTGSPLTVSQTSSFLNTPFTGQTPNFSGTLSMPKGTGPGQYWFSPSAFTPTQSVQMGNTGLGLSWLRGPGLAQLDFSLYRHFNFTERFKLRISAEAQNLTNTPHWNNPGTSCSIVNGACGGSFGQITSAYGQRIIQGGAQLSF